MKNVTEGIEFRRIDVGEVTLNVALKGSGPLVILVHGFPESWYSWRHQIHALSAAGYTVAAPDVRGYGRSDAPHEVEAYDMASLAGDMAGLAVALSPDAPAVIIGHDWGAPIAWHSALLHKDSFRAVAGMSVPYTPPGDVMPLDIFKAIFTDQGHFFYISYFQEEGVAEAELEADPAKLIRRFYYALSGDVPEDAWPTDKPVDANLLDDLAEPDLPLPWLSSEDVVYYASEFERSGLRGPLNRYRNFARDYAMLKALKDHRIHQPSLFIGGDKDMVLRMYPDLDVVTPMKPHMADLRGVHILKGCGHWTQQERVSEVNSLLIDWLSGL